MSATASPARLWSQKEAAALFKVDHRKLAGAALGARIQFKYRASKKGHLLDIDDMRRLAEDMEVQIDLDALAV